MASPRPLSLDRAWLSLPAGLLAAGGVLAFAPLAPPAARMLAITVFCIALWVGGPVPPWFTGLVGIGLIGVTFSTDLALTGFRVPATWLVVLGLLIGVATQESGLGGLVERRALRAMPDRLAGDARGTYRYLLVVMALAGLALTVLVPSSLVRVLVLGPICLSLGSAFDDRRPRLGLFLGPLFVTYYAGTGVLTASLANIIITDLAAESAGVTVGWVEWAARLGPVMGLGRAAAVTAVAYVLYRPAPDAAVDAPDLGAVRAVTGDQRRMLAFLLVGVVVWATDAIHGLHPLYGALVVALLAFAPGIGVVGTEALAEADFSIAFFMGAIFAIAAGLQRTGFTDLAAQRALAVVPPDAPLVLVLFAVVGVSLLLTLVMEGLAVASVLTPVLTSFAASAAVPVVPVLFAEAIALNTYFFPYQSAVLVGILGFGVAEPWELVRMAAVCSLVTVLVLVPLQFGLFALGL